MPLEALPRIPAAASSIQKGMPIKELLNGEAVDCLGSNIRLVYPQFDTTTFREAALQGLEPLGILERGNHMAKALRLSLPGKYESAIDILLASLTPPLEETDKLGLAVLFYLPHVCFIANYGLENSDNGGEDPFDISMRAQYEVTRRFSAEFSIRPFLIRHQQRTLEQLLVWTTDPDPHVRRLCSEGTRPRLPWAKRIPAFINDPSPVFPILEALKDDTCLYVRRSIANHLGDIAKDHPDVAFAICERWLCNASNDMKWLIRHALRHPAKKGDTTALQLRTKARA